MYPVSSDGVNRETSTEVYFYTAAFYPLDNFSAHAVSIWGKTFPTVEHAYQWKKFVATQPEVAQNIFSAASPHLVKEISESNKAKTTEAWYSERIAVMEEVLRAKTSQHKDVRDILEKTESRTIIENSPVDGFWGNGVDGKGENIVGKIWMKIREDL